MRDGAYVVSKLHRSYFEKWDFLKSSWIVSFVLCNFGIRTYRPIKHEFSAFELSKKRSATLEKLYLAICTIPATLVKELSVLWVYLLLN